MRKTILDQTFLITAHKVQVFVLWSKGGISLVHLIIFFYLNITRIRKRNVTDLLLRPDNFR